MRTWAGIQSSWQCQDGGIADRPGDVWGWPKHSKQSVEWPINIPRPDVFHTFFGLAGLSLMRWELLEGRKTASRRADLAPIHCVYALPLEVGSAKEAPAVSAGRKADGVAQHLAHVRLREVA